MDVNNSPTPTGIWYKPHTVAAAVVFMPLIVLTIAGVVIFGWLLGEGLYERAEHSNGKS